MSTIDTKMRGKHLSCIDVYGNQLTVSKGKKGSINFTLYHDEIVEGVARKEFADMYLSITSESGSIFHIAQGLYEMAGNSFVSSEDPIRDGRNFLFIEQDSESSYTLTIGRDLANDLNRPNQTNVEISGRSYEDLYFEASSKSSKQLVKRKRLPQ